MSLLSNIRMYKRLGMQIRKSEGLGWGFGEGCVLLFDLIGERLRCEGWMMKGLSFLMKAIRYRESVFRK